MVMTQRIANEGGASVSAFFFLRRYGRNQLSRIMDGDLRLDQLPLASAFAVAFTIACEVIVARLVASIPFTDCFLTI